jgi:hypothetical protein
VAVAGGRVPPLPKPPAADTLLFSVEARLAAIHG